MGSQNYVSWDPNGGFWLAQKWLALSPFVALIKMLCCYSMQWTGTWDTKTWSNQLCLALRISIKIYLQLLLYHHHSQEYFFNLSIFGWPSVEMLQISMIQIVTLIFSQWLQCLMLVLVICGGFNSRRFSYLKIF